jgi:hypothetical protein
VTPVVASAPAARAGGHGRANWWLPMTSVSPWGPTAVAETSSNPASETRTSTRTVPVALVLSGTDRTTGLDACSLSSRVTGALPGSPVPVTVRLPQVTLVSESISVVLAAPVPGTSHSTAAASPIRNTRLVTRPHPLARAATANRPSSNHWRELDRSNVTNGV